MNIVERPLRAIPAALDNISADDRRQRGYRKTRTSRQATSAWRRTATALLWGSLAAGAILRWRWMLSRPPLARRDLPRQQPPEPVAARSALQASGRLAGRPARIPGAGSLGRARSRYGRAATPAGFAGVWAGVAGPHAGGGAATLGTGGTVVAMASFSFIGPLIYYSNELKPYSCDLAVSLAVTLATLRWMDRPGFRRAAIASAVGAAGIFLSYPAVFVLAGAGTWMLWNQRRSGVLRSALTICLVWGVVFSGGLPNFRPAINPRRSPSPPRAILGVARRLYASVVLGCRELDDSMSHFDRP